MAIYTKLIPTEDIEAVIKVHNSAFKGFFLTGLGSDFLKIYYISVAKAPDGILIGAYRDNELIGFCAACTMSAGFNSRLIKDNILNFSRIGLMLLFTKSKALLRLAKNLTKKGSVTDKGDYAELMSIAVDKKIQNIGAGKAMIDYLEETLRRRGIMRLSLTTDHDDNEATLAFYTKRGFKPMYEFITYPNRKMYRLIKEL